MSEVWEPSFMRLSPSKINTYYKCPREFYYKYIAKLPEQKTIHLFRGTLVHQILEDLFKKEFKKNGYEVQAKLLNAKHFGVAQDRERVIIIGVRNDLSQKGIKYFYPEPTHSEQKLNGQQLNLNGSELKPFKTLKDEIGRFHEPNENEIHGGKFSPLYMSRNRRRKWNEVSFTIQANAMHVPLHPSSCEMVKEETDKFVFKPKNGKYRRLTPKECLAIQSFPRDYIKKIKGSVQQQYTQIGNAVPPLLAQAVAEKLPV